MNEVDRVARVGIFDLPRESAHRDWDAILDERGKGRVQANSMLKSGK